MAGQSVVISITSGSETSPHTSISLSGGTIDELPCSLMYLSTTGLRFTFAKARHVVGPNRPTSPFHTPPTNSH